MVTKLDKGAVAAAPVDNNELRNLAELILEKCTTIKGGMIGSFYIIFGKKVEKVNLELRGQCFGECLDDLIRRLSVLNHTYPNRPITEYVSLQA